MDKKKSQNKLSRTSFVTTKEGLSFSDYFDDSVPYEQKPPEMIRPMQEDDFPIQAKDKFAGLWEIESILQTNHEQFWLDPQGEFHETSYHPKWAKEWLASKNIDWDKSQPVYTAMYKRNFVRVWKTSQNHMIHFQYGDRGDVVVPPNYKQMAALKNAAIELGYDLYDDLKDNVIELQESLMLENVLTAGYAYWLDKNGRFLRAPQGHIPYARQYLLSQGIPYDAANTEMSVYDLMFELQFIRITVRNGVIGFEHGPENPPTPRQMKEMKDTAIESEMKLMDTTTRYKEIDLWESDQPVELQEETVHKSLFIEHMMPEDMDTFKSHLAQLFSYLQKELQLKTVPKVKLVSDDKNAAKVLGKTAYYDPDTRTVVLYITNRHQKDILRSFSHEVIHHWQHENERLQTSSQGGTTKEGQRGESPKATQDPQYAQKDPWLRQMEKQAYLLGNIIFRDWEDQKKAKDRKSQKKMVEKTMLIGKQYPPKKADYRG